MTTEDWMVFVIVVVFALGPFWLALWEYISDWWEENKDREIGSYFSRKDNAPETWSSIRLAEVEHAELSEEFFTWAKEHGVLNHPEYCQYCVRDRQAAVEKESSKITSRFLNRLGLYDPVTELEIWNQWNLHVHETAHRNR